MSPNLKYRKDTLILNLTLSRHQKFYSSQSTYVHTMLVFSYMVLRNVITQREPFNMIRNCQMFRISKFFWPYLSSQRYKTFFFLIDFQAMYMIIQGIFMVYPCLRFFQDHWPQLDELISDFYITIWNNTFTRRGRWSKNVHFLPTFIP